MCCKLHVLQIASVTKIAARKKGKSKQANRQANKVTSSLLELLVAANNWTNKKFFDQNKFGQNILDQQKICLLNIIVKQNNFWSKKMIFGQKNRLQENVVSEGKLLITKFIYGWKKMVVRKNFLLKFFLDTIIIIQVLVWKNFAQ